MIGDNFLVAAFERQDVPNGIFSKQKMVVSDHINVREHVSGIGIPAWSENAQKSDVDASIVTQLMASGMVMIGKGQVDDFGVSISGKNAFYSDLRNPINRKCRVGGASSGIAVAVASGKATLGVGNASNGGVTVPAAYCNLYGYRPTPGMLDMLGVKPLSATFDSVGFMSKSIPLLQQVFEKCSGPRQMLALSGIQYATNLFKSLLTEEQQNKVSEKLTSVNCPLEENTSLSKILLTQSAQIHAVIMGREVEMEYGEWLDSHKPSLDEETQQYLDSIRGFDFKELVEAKKKKAVFSETLCSIFKSGELLMVPTMPGTAPPRTGDLAESYFQNQKRLIAIGEVAGLPQLTIPFLQIDEFPFGISLLAQPNEDKLLFDAAMRWF
ncbi:hypothetical protein CS022_04045 [Veronia nyctiphanis]|uniref:Amidase domain-containing protein n=1 Tax=Veronia nyctiphanis TaxID=1278244 RepID=A0A4Q0YSP8_9GAMM|nr:amidase family protein [Veronia nyctiphanis]RXJ74242.1 hypothetical protein CS022_04045 [Veronia nyctiphanis]